MTRLATSWILIPLASISFGCGQTPAVLETPQTEAAPATHQAQAASAQLDYSGWEAVTKESIRVSQDLFELCIRHPESLRRGLHWVPAVRVYANPVACEHLRHSDMATMPVESIVVKEKWRNEQDKAPAAYAAMIKREAGYDPEHGDWEYLYAELGDGARVERGRLQNCIECHSGAAAQDYLFRTYLKFETTVANPVSEAKENARP